MACQHCGCDKIMGGTEMTGMLAQDRCAQCGRIVETEITEYNDSSVPDEKQNESRI